jgi:type IV secretion system protein TrbL
MESFRLPKYALFPLFLWLALFSANAYADIDSAGLFDNVLDRYKIAASAWAATITTHATWLFWTLALISMVWTFGMMALRKADIAEFFAEFIRFTVFTGFFWWLLINGPNFATSIMDSLRKIGVDATGTGAALTPSGIVDIGFDIFAKVLTKSTIWSPFSSAVGIAISLIILIVLALIGVNMLLLLISAWILAYAGVFFLGFGGSRWTSEMAIGYFKTVLSIGAQLLTMILLVGIGKSFIDDFYSRISAGINLNELAVILVVAIVLLALANRVPGLVGSLAMGGGTGSLGAGLGAGAVGGAAAMGAAAAATAGAAIMTGGANIVGGAHALMAAFSKAHAAESSSNNTQDLMGPHSANGGGRVFGGGSPLAAAMGDNPGGGTSGGRGGNAEDIEGHTITDQNGAKGNSEADSNRGTAEVDETADNSKASADANSQNSTSTNSNAAKTKTPSGRLPPLLGIATAAKVGRVVAGTAANLAKGSWDVGKNRITQFKNAGMNRVGETTGGKIAAAIKASNTKSTSSASMSSTFKDDSLSAGASKAADATAEVAAFRDRNSKPLGDTD